uniref:dUTPase-like domain-containing protein n=1 Tax=Macaca mulatta TaxID=9544 RepID=A0A5F7ZE21_MACMU
MGRNQEVETGVAPLNIIPSDPLAKFLLPAPMTLSSAGLEILVPERGMLPAGDTIMSAFNWKSRLPPSHFGLCVPLNQQAKEGVTVLTRVTDSDYRGEIGLLLHNGDKEECLESSYSVSSYYHAL